MSFAHRSSFRTGLPRPARVIADPGHTVLLSATEPLTLTGALRLRDKAERLAPNCRCLLVDLHGAEFADSSGVRSLLQWAEELESLGKELRLVVVTGSRIDRTLSLLQLQDRLRVFATIRDAWTWSRADVN